MPAFAPSHRLATQQTEVHRNDDVEAPARRQTFQLGRIRRRRLNEAGGLLSARHLRWRIQQRSTRPRIAGGGACDYQTDDAPRPMGEIASDDNLAHNAGVTLSSASASTTDVSSPKEEPPSADGASGPTAEESPAEELPADSLPQAIAEQFEPSSDPVSPYELAYCEDEEGLLWIASDKMRAFEGKQVVLETDFEPGNQGLHCMHDSAAVMGECFFSVCISRRSPWVASHWPATKP